MNIDFSIHGQSNLDYFGVKALAVSLNTIFGTLMLTLGLYLSFLNGVGTMGLLGIGASNMLLIFAISLLIIVCIDALTSKNEPIAQKHSVIYEESPNDGIVEGPAIDLIQPPSPETPSNLSPEAPKIIPPHLNRSLTHPLSSELKQTPDVTPSKEVSVKPNLQLVGLVCIYAKKNDTYYESAFGISDPLHVEKIKRTNPMYHVWAGPLGEKDHDVNLGFPSADVERVDGKPWKFPSEMVIKCKVFNLKFKDPSLAKKATSDTPLRQECTLYLPYSLFLTKEGREKTEGNIVEFCIKGYHYALTWKSLYQDGEVLNAVQFMIRCAEAYYERGGICHFSPLEGKFKYSHTKYICPRDDIMVKTRLHAAMRRKEALLQAFPQAKALNIQYPFPPIDACSFGDKVITCILPRLNPHSIAYFYGNTQLIIYARAIGYGFKGDGFAIKDVPVNPLEHPHLAPQEYLLEIPYTQCSKKVLKRAKTRIYPDKLEILLT